MKRTLVAVMPFVLLLGLPAGARSEQFDPVKTAQMRTQKPGDASGAANSGDAGLRTRVEQLEEQLVDLQVVIGTLESLAKPGGNSPSASRYGDSGGGYDGGARVDGLETQIKALTAQMQNLSQQVQALGGQSKVGESAPLAAAPQGMTSPQVATAAQTGAASPGMIAPQTSIQPPPGEALPPVGAAPQQQQQQPTTTAAVEPRTEARFGSTTVTSAQADPIGGLISSGHGQGNQGSQPQNMAAIAPTTPVAPNGANGMGAIDVNPKQLYETAYGYLLQQDYASAEASFSDFLTRFPGDSLAGNAQYWLGESFFVRGQYKQAASAFLKGYQTYDQNAKAPDSLLKLAMSLDRLGQKDAACSSFSELNTRFPTAPPHIKNRAQSERQRIGCT